MSDAADSPTLANAVTPIPPATDDGEGNGISAEEIAALDPDLRARVEAKLAAGPLRPQQRDFFQLLQRNRDKVKRVRDLLGPEPGPAERRMRRPMEFVTSRDNETRAIQSVRVLSVEARPEGTQPGDRYSPWRATTYDQDGPSGHDVFVSLDEAAKYLAGYTTGELAPGTIAEWSKTGRWARGVELLARIQRASLAASEESERQQAADDAEAAREALPAPAARSRGR
jgi:hypothetical protein